MTLIIVITDRYWQEKYNEAKKVFQVLVDCCVIFSASESLLCFESTLQTVKGGRTAIHKGSLLKENC